MADSTIRIAQSCAHGPREAVAELYDGLVQPEMSLVLFFCSSLYDRDELAGQLSARFAGVQVIGCTTAGEIGPAGCREHSLAGVSFGASVCTPVVGRLEGLTTFHSADGVAVAQDLRRRLGATLAGAAETSTFAFLLIDGLFGHEEQVAHALQRGLGDIPLVGGSAGDSLDFEGTYIYWDGRFSRDAAVLVLAATPLPLTEFKTQHFTATHERLVVTAADPARRVVREINGLPARQEYARVLGVDPAELSPSHFAASPLVVLVDGSEYVRSIQRIEPDGLKFYCAIDRGVVLRVARGVDLVENLEAALARVRSQIGPPQLVLTFDCILRKLEIDQRHVREAVSEVLRRHNAVGFNTYGEQFCGVHVNQTMTAIAFGRPAAARDDG